MNTLKWTVLFLFAFLVACQGAAGPHTAVQEKKARDGAFYQRPPGAYPPLVPYGLSLP